MDIKAVVHKNMTEFAKEFQQVFWLNSQYCKQRNETDKEKPCMGCESRMLCAISGKLLENTLTILETKQTLHLTQMSMKVLEDVNMELHRQNQNLMKELLHAHKT